MKMRFEVLSAILHPFCLGLNVLNSWPAVEYFFLNIILILTIYKIYISTVLVKIGIYDVPIHFEFTKVTLFVKISRQALGCLI